MHERGLMKPLGALHKRGLCKAPRDFMKPQYRGLVLSGSCDQLYIYDKGSLTRRSVPATALKREDCPCRYMNLYKRHPRKGLHIKVVFAKSLNRRSVLPGSCDKFYIYDSNIDKIRASQKVKKKEDCACRYMDKPAQQSTHAGDFVMHPGKEIW